MHFNCNFSVFLSFCPSQLTTLHSCSRLAAPWDQKHLGSGFALGVPRMAKVYSRPAAASPARAQPTPVDARNRVAMSLEELKEWAIEQFPFLAAPEGSLSDLSPWHPLLLWPKGLSPDGNLALKSLSPLNLRPLAPQADPGEDGLRGE